MKGGRKYIRQGPYPTLEDVTLHHTSQVLTQSLQGTLSNIFRCKEFSHQPTKLVHYEWDTSECSSPVVNLTLPDEPWWTVWWYRVFICVQLWIPFSFMNAICNCNSHVVQVTHFVAGTWHLMGKLYLESHNRPVLFNGFPLVKQGGCYQSSHWLSRLSIQKLVWGEEGWNLPFETFWLRALLFSPLEYRGIKLIFRTVCAVTRTGLLSMEAAVH